MAVRFIPKRAAVTTNTHDWVLAAPFELSADQEPWLTPWVDARHRFSFVGRNESNWHLKKRPVSGIDDWRNYERQMRDALHQRSGGGIITMFPQLAVCAGFHKRISRGHWPHVAYWFNTVGTSRRFAGLARTALRDVDLFVVHNTSEIPVYAEWLDLPEERFRFVPLQKQAIADPAESTASAPLIFATGSGERDYATFFAAVEGQPWKVVCAPGKHAVAGLKVPSNVEITFDISLPEIRRLGQTAAVNVIPMRNSAAAAGTVTIVEALRLGAASVVTDRKGVGDYLTDGETALLVEPGNVEQLRDSIARLYDDTTFRSRISSNVYEYGERVLSEEQAGRNVTAVLDDVVAAGR